MSPLAVFALCVQACLIQSVMSCPSSICSCNNLGGYSANRLSYGLAPTVGLSAACGSYGGAGSGQVGVVGDVCASGSTSVAGTVPALGSASFCGSLPARGSVSIAGQCGCGCGIY